MSHLISGAEQLLLYVLVLGVVVAFHELGHFLAAKAFGVRVEVFSLGFGAKIFGRKWGETEYRVAAIPLGGYVLMGGDMSGDEDRPRHPRDYDAQPVPARLAIMLAGPVFSALLGILLMWGAFAWGVEAPSYLRESPRVGSVAEGSPAAAAGLLPGDLVVSAAGRPAPTWEAFEETVLTNPEARIEVEVDRGGERVVLPVDVQARTKYRIGWIGAAPCSVVVARAIQHGSPALAAGVRPGDRIMAVDGTEPCSDSGLVDLVQQGKGATVTLDLDRGGTPVRVAVTPRFDEKANLWLMGVSPAPAMSIQRHGVADAFVESCRYNRDKALLVVDVLGKLVTGRISIFSTSGPLEIASITQETAKLGLIPVVQLVALITINLAIFNLFPIPILDGGKILLLLVEAVRGRDLQRRTKEWILQAGLAMIVVLMVVVLVADAIKKWS